MSHRFKLSRLLAVAAGLALAVPLAGAAVLAQPAVAATAHHRLAEWFVRAEPGRGGRRV